jgi:4-amino-4-deoxy-L-arabinose transferase-like glycosyltransferase
MQWIRQNLVWIGLVFVVLLGASLRLYRIGSIPSSYAFDEVGIMYDAWSISLWHRDQFAHFMPLSFQSFGDFKPPAMIYTLAVLYSLFGVHDVFIRLISAGAGIGSIVIMFFVARSFFHSHIQRDWIGLLSAFVVATSPWSIHLSRLGFEQNLAFFLGLVGIWMFISGFRKSTWWYGAVMFLCLSMYTFHTAKIFIPLVVLGGLIIHFRTLFQRRLIPIEALGIALIAPLVYSTFFGHAGARSETLVFSSTTESAATAIWQNIIAYVSPSFWIFGQDAVSIRHAVPGFGVLLIPWYGLLLISLGLLILSHSFRNLTWKLWLLMLAGFVPTLISRQAPHVLRSQFGLIGVALLIGFCGVYCLDWLMAKKKVVGWIVGGLLIVAIGWNLAAYQIAYYSSYPSLSAESFQYGYREAVAYLAAHKTDQDTILVSNVLIQPYIYLLFYNHITPQEFMFGGLNQYMIVNQHWPDTRSHALFLSPPEEIPITDPHVVKLITDPWTNKPLLVIAKNE